MISARLRVLNVIRPVSTVNSETPPSIAGALTIVLRTGSRAERPSDPTNVRLRLDCLTTALGCAGPDAGNDAALRAALVDFGVIDDLVAACVPAESTIHLFAALTALCGPLGAAPDACTRRIFTAGGVGAATAALNMWDKVESKSVIAYKGLLFLHRLLHVMNAAPLVADVFVSEVLKHQDGIVDALIRGLAGPALAELHWTTSCVSKLGSFALFRIDSPGAPRRADRIVDAVVAALRKMLPEHAASSELAGFCAFTLNACAGACSGNDAAAPGTRALCAGALPLLESMLPTVEAELAGGGLSMESREEHAGVIEYVRLLRGLAAQREAAAASLVADEEAERAQRSKAAQGGKTKSSKAGKAKKKQTQAEVQQATAAFAAVSVAEASAAPTEPPPATQPAPEHPVLPPPSPPPQPVVPVLPPPLPPWLLQAMQQPPPPQPAAPPPAALPPAAPSGAWAQRPQLHAAAAVPQRHPAASAALPQWNVAAPPPPKMPAGAWGRARPAILGLSAGEVPRELECAICLDALAVGVTPCCGQTAFCAACAVTLRAECPLCRALPGAAA